METYPKSNVTQYGYDTPLKTRLGKSASDHRVDPIIEEEESTEKTLVSTIQEVSLDNIRLQEDLRHVTEEYAAIDEEFGNLLEDFCNLQSTYEALMKSFIKRGQEIKVLQEVIDDLTNEE